MKSTLALIALFVVPSGGFSFEDHHGHIRGNANISRFDTISMPTQGSAHAECYYIKNNNNSADERRAQNSRRQVLRQHHIRRAMSSAELEESENYHNLLGTSMSMLLDLYDTNATLAKSSKAKPPKSTKDPKASKKSTGKNPKPKTPKPKSPKNKKCPKKKPKCFKDLCTESKLSCTNGKWLCHHQPKACADGFSCDLGDGKCTKNTLECSDMPKPFCIRPQDQCMTNTSTCVNDTLWICEVAPMHCEDGFICNAGSCVDANKECNPIQRPVCETPKVLCMQNSSACVNATWGPCVVTPNCREAEICDSSDGICKKDGCAGPAVECLTPQDNCTLSNTSACVNNTWACVAVPKCEGSYFCDSSDGLCKVQVSQELILDSSILSSDTLILDNIDEDQVVWDVSFASRRTSIDGRCTVQILSQSNATQNVTVQTSNFSYFMDWCSSESIGLHVTFPRTTRTVCFNGEQNCRPVMCSLGGPLHKIDLEGDLSSLSYAPGNNELLFGLNKNCEISEPYHWKEFVDIVIGPDFKTKWSNDELYRMDFDGDGLTNIVEYYGLRLGDMYVDIAHGGHPPVFNPDWPFPFPSTATDPYSYDTDSDLLTDSFELLYGMDPRDFNDINADSDGEGLTDFQEQISGTSPFKNDTDGDSVNDFQELQDGTNPLDDSDFINATLPSGRFRQLELSPTIPITLEVGDPSLSESERWVIRVGSIEHAATQFGVVSTGTYNFHSGVYPITVRHIDSNLDSPDYDYFAAVSWPSTSEFSHFEVSLDDPDNLLDEVYYSSDVDRTIGLIAYLHIKRIQEECNYDTCIDCNADSKCEWDGERKSCQIFDGLIAALKHTPDDCACRKCSLWAHEEQEKGLDWIDNLPHCPCHVIKDSVSASAISINMLTFEGGVTRVLTSLNPEGSEVAWNQDIKCNPNNAKGCSDYHPGALGCLRTPAFTGPHGQQCCYESNGDYIAAGTQAAGTPDMYYPGKITNLPDHYFSDVLPYDWCCKKCETSTMCELYIGSDPSNPGVRSDLRGCKVYTPSVCGDGICESAKGETCPQDCNPVNAVCGDGFCDHGETSDNCASDCPHPPLTTPALPSDPHDLTADFLELASRCADLSDAVYSKEKALSIKTVRDNFWEYILPDDPTEVVDAALISREYDKGRCIIALRGTNMKSTADMKQIFNPFTRSVDDGTGKSCIVREGFAQAFFGTTSSGDPIPYHYGERLAARINQCVADKLKLVFTGHSQGGGLALVGHLRYNAEKPISITFAAPPTFVNTNIVNDGYKDPCPAIMDSQTYRFINTVHHEVGLYYDLVPFVKEVLEQVPLIALPSMFPFLAGIIMTRQELIRRAGMHKGPVALLRPEPAELLPPQPAQSIKVYNSQTEMHAPSLLMFDIVDYDLVDLGDMFSGDNLLSAHTMTSYAEKVKSLSSQPAEGFVRLTRCNFDAECYSGTCEPPEDKRCIRLLLNNKYDCESHEDCVDQRCNFNLFGYETCQPKLDTGLDCERDEDCKTSYCTSSKCTAKLSNGSLCYKNQHCQSGYCALDGLLMHCAPLIKDMSSTCLTDDSCWTGRCKGFRCAYKLFDGNSCDDDADCQDGSFCAESDTCRKKLGLMKICEEHSECTTGLRCDYPAKKICTEDL